MMFVGGACRFRVVGKLQHQYSSPRDAKINLLPDCVASASFQIAELSLDCEDYECNCRKYFEKLPSSQQIELISKLYNVFTSNFFPDVSVPPNYLELSLKAMKRLQSKNRSNILFGLARGLAILREDGSDSLIPISRMPFGLLEYVIEFFQSAKVSYSSYSYCLYLHLYVNNSL